MSLDAKRAATQSAWPLPQTVGIGVTGIALGLAVAGLASYHSGWATLAMVVLVIAATAIFVRALGWSVGLAVLLIVTCLIDRNTFPVGRLNVRPEQIAGVLALLAWVAFALRSSRNTLVWPDRTELALIAWFALAFVSSVAAPPNRVDSLKVLALLILSSLGLFSLRRLVANRPEQLDAVVGWALLAFAVECAYASLAYFVHVFGPTISLSVNPATGQLDAYGTLWEPNVLGAMAGAGAVGWVFIGPRFFKHAWIGVAVCLTACAVSFARAAWLAVIVVILLTLATPIRRRIDLRTLGLGALGTVLSTAWILASDRIGNYTQGRGIGSSVGSATDLLGRLYQFAPAFTDLKAHPILGGGIDSFGQRHVQVGGTPEHLGNLELLILNDTGLLGLLVFVAFLVTILLAVWRCREHPIVLGLAAMTMVIAIANQATETLELMITWLLIGLLLAATDAASRVSSPAIARTARYTGS
ncbi:MAG TPA: O-antigen ligase family protein [Candidatus Dormibacteraeota bacterium]|nr:O-antigen ligase family protein [Candidatus Dormibacteraeota bacterium]